MCVRARAADIACYGYAAQWWWAGLSVADKPHVSAWLERVGSRAAIKASLGVPGVSTLGKGGVTFSDMCNDVSLQRTIEASAVARGSPHFGWADLTILLQQKQKQEQQARGGAAAGSGEDAAAGASAVAFASHVPTGHTAKKKASSAMSPAELLIVGALAGAVATLAVGTLVQLARRRHG